MVGCEFVQEIEEKQGLIEIQTSVSNRCVQHSCIYDIVRIVLPMSQQPSRERFTYSYGCGHLSLNVGSFILYHIYKRSTSYNCRVEHAKNTCLLDVLIV